MDVWSSQEEMKASIDTVSLGMVVIDEIHLPSRRPLVHVMGGSGAYDMIPSDVARSAH